MAGGTPTEIQYQNTVVWEEHALREHTKHSEPGGALGWSKKNTSSQVSGQSGQGGIREERRSQGKQGRGVSLQVTHCRARASPLHEVGRSGVGALRMDVPPPPGYAAHSGAWEGTTVWSFFRWPLRNTGWEGGFWSCALSREIAAKSTSIFSLGIKVTGSSGT